MTSTPASLELLDSVRVDNNVVVQTCYARREIGCGQNKQVKVGDLMASLWNTTPSITLIQHVNSRPCLKTA